MIALYGGAAMLLAAVVAASVIGEVPVAKFTRDPAAIAETHPLQGVVSNLGVLLWCIAATAGLLCWLVLRRYATRRGAARLALTWGAISWMLLFDDLFMIHDDLGPRMLGIAERPLFAAYGVAVAAVLIGFRRRILVTAWPVLASAFAFFALSVGVDLLPESLLEGSHHLFEDGFKFLGIVGWTGYHVHTCVESLTTDDRAGAEHEVEPLQLERAA